MRHMRFTPLSQYLQGLWRGRAIRPAYEGIETEVKQEVPLTRSQLM